MKELSLNSYRIYTETEDRGERFILLEADTFNAIPLSFDYEIENIYYRVTAEKGDDYIWFYIVYGKPYPWADTVLNMATRETKENPRALSEAELNHQLFCLCQFTNHRLYISDSRKINFFTQLLRDKFGINLESDKEYKSLEDFISTIKEINKISFTDAHTLFSQNSKQRQALKDLTGTNAPEYFSIEASYKKVGLIEGFLKRVNKEAKSLIIRGRDEKGIEKIFNTETFSRKITFKCQTDTGGLFMPFNVQYQLLEFLKNEG